MAERRTELTGALFAIVSFGTWGFNPIYFRAVRHVGAFELLAHRIVWSLPLLLAIIAVSRGWTRLRAPLRSRRQAAVLVATACFIAINWVVFIWAVYTGRILQASLGYFINPLVNVLFGRLFLGERLRRGQALAVALAAAGVAWLGWRGGELPWISLVLATSFATYGLLRKTAAADAVSGLTLEVLFLLPAAVGWLTWLELDGRGHLGSGWRQDLLLATAGIVTVVPLLFFVGAARRLTLTALGFFQYLAPTGHFLLAVLAFGEPFGSAKLVAFVGIWSGLAVFSIEGLRHRRRSREIALAGAGGTALREPDAP